MWRSVPQVEQPARCKIGYFEEVMQVEVVKEESMHSTLPSFVGAFYFDKRVSIFYTAFDNLLGVASHR
jgi:hypothetical protein